MTLATTRYSLNKIVISPSSDTVDVVNDFNVNWDAIDAKLGTQLCTLGAMPSTPPQGMLAFTTDTFRVAVNKGTSGSPVWKTINTYSNVVNAVTDYGADPTGAADSTTAINNALSAQNAAGGGRVYLPAGTYKVTPSGSPAVGITFAGVSAGFQNVILEGDSEGGTVLKKAANGTLLQLSAPSSDTTGANHAKFCTLQNITLNGNGFTGLLLQCYYADDLNFWNVNFNGNPDTCVDTAEFWDSRFWNCAWVTNGSTTANAVAPNMWLRDSAANAGFGNSTDNVNQIHFFGCRWEDFKTGAVRIEQGLTNSSNPNGIYFTNCKMETSKVNGGSHLFVDTNAKFVHAQNLYCYSGGFQGGFSTAQDVITFGGQNSSLTDVDIANGGTATVANGITVNSGTFKKTISLERVRGTYNTSPTGGHINYGTMTGNVSVVDCYSDTGPMFNGATPSFFQKTPVTTPVTIANTVTNTLMQSHSVLGGEPFIGSTYEIEGSGNYSVTGTPTLKFGVYWGGIAGTLLVASAAITAPTSGITAATFRYRAVVNFITATTAECCLKVELVSNTSTGGVAYFEYATTAAVTVTTSSTSALAIGFQWGTASASNTITLRGGRTIKTI